MGDVYRALDRLSGEAVALKRLGVPMQMLRFMTSSAHQDLRLALAAEFQLLASLRHPNIISVLDYGFDSEGFPFFTMELMEGGRNILAAGEGASVEQRVELLVQVLQALAYLHRRNIIHRDVKPDNVLVAGDKLKVLDFGLSIAPGQKFHKAEGTIHYIAPEVMQGGPVTVAADFYAVGVIAYQLFSGRLPFTSNRPDLLVKEIMREVPDLTEMNVPGELKIVFRRLLAKNPAARYTDALAIIRDLSAAIQKPLAEETASIRESFLNAATFVGRDEELGQLEEALENALKGVGSAWLVGGENGVGKSRLVDELRIRALVKGVLVLRGQGVREGSLAFQIWREPVRRLLLSTHLDDVEAAILAKIVPGIENLVGRGVSRVEELEGTSARQRLAGAIVSLFTRQTQPILLILEDLHWAEESFDVLHLLNEQVGDKNLLIVGNFRDDEFPTIPEALPRMHLMKLERLSQEQINDLSYAMLGEVGRRPQVTSFLHQETEGNVFFLVEVVRALAEEAGQLSEIGHKTLPERVLAGGVRALIQRRLAQIPEWARPLLQLAAIIGRGLNVRLLRTLAPELDLERWLLACADAAVLEVHEQNWRFVHDKLREGVLDDIAEEERPQLHSQIATALEKLYPDDLSYAPVLAVHWRRANHHWKEQYYAHLAGLQMLNVSAYREALSYFQRALHLLPELGDIRYEEMLLKSRIGHVYFHLSDYETAGNYYRESRLLAQGLLAVTGLSDALYGLGRVAVNLARYDEALDTLDQSLLLYDISENYPGSANVLRELSNVYASLGMLEEAVQYAERALKLYQFIGNPRGQAGTLAALGVSYRRQGKPMMALAYFGRALNISKETGNRHEQAFVLSNMGLAHMQLGELNEARTYFEESLSIYRQIGDRWGTAYAFSNLGTLYQRLGQVERALVFLDESLEVRQSIGDRLGQSIDLDKLGEAYQTLGQLDEAIDYFREALALCESISENPNKGYILSDLGLAYAMQGEMDIAVETLEAGLAAADARQLHEIMKLSRINLTRVHLYRGDVAAAWEAISAAREYDYRELNHVVSALQGIILCRWDDHAAAERAFQENLHQTDELLAKTPGLMVAQYTRCLALSGLALAGSRPLEEAVEACLVAVAGCAGRGIIEDTRRLLEILQGDDGRLQPVMDALLKPLADEPEPNTD
jgi:tetratricopeptide (TPR) repeat protein